MNLGETIYRLRTQRGMSQGDLAEALDVSRQSISKWENNSATPELTKLVKLAELFGVSLDALVRGAEQTPEPAQEQTQSQPQAAAPMPQRGLAGRKIAGIVLLSMAFVTLLVFTIFTGPLGGLLCALPFLLTGLCCFVFRRHVGLWCAWALFLLFSEYLRAATGITWSLVYLTRIYQASWNDTRLAFAWGILGARLLLAVITVWILRKKPFSLSRKRLLLLLGGWVVLGLLCIPLPLASTDQWIVTAMTALDYLRLGLLTFLATRTVNALLAWRKARKRP